MSKRRNHEKQPNLPKATLERARQQAAQGAAAEDARPTAPAAAKAPAAASAEKPAASVQRRRKVTSAQLERSQKRGEKTYDMVQYLLAHPTKEVTEAELRAAYGYVLRDLRNMGLLAAALVVCLILLAQVF